MSAIRGDADRGEFVSSQDIAQLLADARHGSLAAQGRLLEAFRGDLLAIAAANLDSDITRGWSRFA